MFLGKLFPEFRIASWSFMIILYANMARGRAIPRTGLLRWRVRTGIAGFKDDSGHKVFFSVRMLRDIFLMRKSQKTFGGALKDKMHPIVTIAVFVWFCGPTFDD